MSLYWNLFQAISFNVLLYYCSLFIAVYFIVLSYFSYYFPYIKVVQYFSYCNLFYLLSKVIPCSSILLLLINYHYNIFYLSFQLTWSNANLYYWLILFQFYFNYLCKLIYLMFLYTTAYYYYYHYDSYYYNNIFLYGYIILSYQFLW